MGQRLTASQDAQRASPPLAERWGSSPAIPRVLPPEERPRRGPDESDHHPHHEFRANKPNSAAIPSEWAPWLCATLDQFAPRWTTKITSCTTFDTACAGSTSTTSRTLGAEP